MKSIKIYLLFGILFFQLLSCEQVDLQPDPKVKACESEPTIGLQNQYNVIVDRYSWNLGQGVIINDSINAIIKFSEIGMTNFKMVIENKSYFFILDTITDHEAGFSISSNNPHNHYWVSLNCITDSCYVNIGYGSLGYDDKIKAKFKYK